MWSRAIIPARRRVCVYHPYPCVDAWMPVRVYACMRACVHARTLLQHHIILCFILFNNRTNMCIYIYIYTYVERERDVYICLSLSLYIYVYIYIYAS